MLSIQPLKSAEGAANYYLKSTNYYSPDSKSIRWLGEGAKILNIHNTLVEKPLMLDLLNGKLPDGSQLGRKDKAGIHHRPGFDMTLSAPKSFSILLESGADPRLADALNKSVEWFVAEIEKEFAQTRVMIDGKIEYVDTKNFTIAAFRQPNSRANDPQSHVHLVAMNMTQTTDGKWHSLASDMNAEKGVVEQIMKYHIYAGLKFRNKLGNLTKALGYTLETSGDGLWEIKDVPKEVLGFFSKRRGDIENYMETKSWKGAKNASIATQRTKTEKQIVNFPAWKEDILTACKNFGFDPKGFVAETLAPKSLFTRIKTSIVEKFYDKEELQTLKADEALYVAIEAVSQQSAVFTPRKIKEQALKHVIASNWMVDESYLDKALDKSITNQKLYSNIDPISQKTMLTTPWQLDLESETIARIEKGKGAIKAICSESKIRAFIKTKEEALQFKLSPSQKSAMLGFLKSTDRFMAIQGYAGTGKTTMLNLTRELAEAQGYDLRGITAGSSAANELKIKGGLNANTFARELLFFEKNNLDLKKTIFVVDEASMLSNPQGHKIIQLIEEAGSQLKIIGDKAQLPSPSSGKWFSLTQEYGIDTAQMTDNLRQEQGLLKEAALHASRGEIYDAINKLTAIKEKESYLERVEETANTWLKLSESEREKTLCFAPTHKNRHDITAFIRDELKETGKLNGPQLDQDILLTYPLKSIELRQSIYYSRDNVLRFNLSLPRYKIKSGDYLTVDELKFQHKKNNCLPLIRDNGHKITVPLSALPKFKEANKDLERPIEVYKKSFIELQSGDIIQWKRNSQALGVNNSDIGRVENISEDEITIKKQDDKLITINLKAQELKHLDHGYVLTTYAAQGKDKKRGIGFIESFNKFAATVENFYVEITRAVEQMIIITDNKNNLVKAITNRSQRQKSSLTFANSALVKEHANKQKETEEKEEKSFSLQSVISKKEIKESEWQAMESKINAYNKAKESVNKRQASIEAMAIVKNPINYQLARERLAYNYREYKQDAFKLETANIFLNLNGEEKEQFSRVKNYAYLSQELGLKIKSMMEITDTEKDKIDTEKDKEENGKDVINTEKNKIMSKKSKGKALRKEQINLYQLDKANIEKSKESNQKVLRKKYLHIYQLASDIAKDLEAHKPWLKHFSIGEANRLGLPQHEIDQENTKAYSRIEKLAKHASLHQLRTKISDYIKGDETEKLKLAHQIKREAKKAHEFIIDFAESEGKSPGDLWKTIHFDARRQSDTIFRQGLNPKAKEAFDVIKEYKTLQGEIKASWSNAIKGTDHIKDTDQNEKKPQLDEKTKQLMTLKNQLAHQLQNNPAVIEVASYFKMDMESLKKQSIQHEFRETVFKLLSNNSNFKEKMTIAKEIKDNVKGHYPYLMDAKINLKTLNRYFLVIEREERLSSLAPEEKTSYKNLLQYKTLSRQTASAWKKSFSLNENQVKEKQAEIFIAKKKSALRDAMAYKIKGDPYLENHLTQERVDAEKLNKQANDHLLKQNHIKMMEQRFNQLIHKQEALENQGTPKKIALWKEELTTLMNEVNRTKNNPAYAEVLKNEEVSLQKIKQGYFEFKEKYAMKEKKDYKTQDHNKNEYQEIKKKHTFFDAKTLNNALMTQAEATYKSIFGEPKSINSKEMRYSGGLVIALKGNNQGLWYDFTQGKGGLPLDAIMMTRNLNFKEALEVAAEMTGLSKSSMDFKPIQVISREKQTLNFEKSKKNSILSAQSIWNGSIPIKGTLGEIYLQKYRGIEKADKLDLRFWPKGSTWLNTNEEGILEEKINKIPALILSAKNSDNQITGVQRIYLDRNGSKNQFMDNPKLSKGVIEGSASIIQRGMKGSSIYIAEGPETAASIANALPNSTVMASLGLANIKNLSPLIHKLHGNKVIIAADFDGENSKTSAQVELSAETLRKTGLNVKVIYPQAIDGLKKTDWNDVLIHKGKEFIELQFLDKKAVEDTTSYLKATEDRNQKISIAQPNEMSISDKNKDPYQKETPSFTPEKTRVLEMEI